jgi:hypothetical protein
VTLLQGTSPIGGNDMGPTDVKGFIAADFTEPGLSLRFEGCGEDATVPLDTRFPDAVSYTASADGKQLTWPVVPNNGFLIDDTGSFAGELCRTEPDAVSAPTPYPATELSVQALLGPVATSSGSISFQLWGTN